MMNRLLCHVYKRRRDKKKIIKKLPPVIIIVVGLKFGKAVVINGLYPSERQNMYRQVKYTGKKHDVL